MSDSSDQEGLDPRKLSRLPHHVAVIMDGNGRWAKARGFPRIKGHSAGVEAIRDTATACAEWGIQYLTLYSFSTENWARPRAEVQFLMRLLQRYLREEIKILFKNNIRLNAIGFLDDLPPRVQKNLADVIARTEKNTGLVLTLALSYGSRAEILDAVRALAVRIAAGELSPDEIDEALFASSLHTADMPDPDLLIRTSGEMRISNFLLWQVAYTELWVTPILWPDFRRGELYRAFEEFAQRDRRYGKVKA